MIIKIEAYNNGSHANQSTTPRVIPEGWAVVPDGLDIPDTFPFVNIEVKDGVVVNMTAGVVPPIPEVEPEATVDELIDIMLGVVDDE